MCLCRKRTNAGLFFYSFPPSLLLEYSLSFLKISFIYLFIYGCVGSLSLHEGPLQLRQAGANPHRGARAIAASLVAEHRLQTRRLSSCGSRAQLLHGMWDPPRPGLEPASPAPAGRFSTTAPPGKPLFPLFMSGFLFPIPHLL